MSAGRVVERVVPLPPRRGGGQVRVATGAELARGASARRGAAQDAEQVSALPAASEAAGRRPRLEGAEVSGR